MARRTNMAVVDIDVYYITDSPKAICITDGSTYWTGGGNGKGYQVVNRYWLPKSQVEFECKGSLRIETIEKLSVMDCIVTLPKWLCEEKNLEDSAI